MTTFFLDLGAKTGWALNENCVITSGTKNLKEKGRSEYAKFLEFLYESVFPKLPNKIMYEKVFAHKGTLAAHRYGGYEALLIVLAEVYGVALLPIAVQTIKKMATGRGNATKAEIIEAVQSVGYRPKDDNEADALAMCIFCNG